MTWTPYAEQEWIGHEDDGGPETGRWDQHVRRTMIEASTGASTRWSDTSPSFGLLGFASDEGVRRTGGRPGANDGPASLRRALASLAIHAAVPVHDLGTVSVSDTDLEAAQDELGDHVATALDSHSLVAVLGGGNETAWGSYLGRSRSERLADARVGVISLDAHLGLADADRAGSNTPFLQMARADEAEGKAFDYTAIGVAEPSNTRAQFANADHYEATYRLDVRCTARHLEAVIDQVLEVIARNDAIHLCVDLDVLPAAVAPGVSSPAGYGIAVEVVEALCYRIAASGKLALVDMIGLCPPHDIGDHTARTAARLVTTCLHAAPRPDALS